MSFSGLYTVSFSATTIANASGDYDLFELTPVDDIPIEVVGYSISVYSELGDAQEEFLQCQWVSDNTTTGGGTAATPRPTNPRMTAAGFTAETVATAPATGGTTIMVEPLVIPSRGGDRVWYPEGCGPRVDQADTMLCLRLNVAVVDDLTMSGCVWVAQV